MVLVGAYPMLSCHKDCIHYTYEHLAEEKNRAKIKVNISLEKGTGFLPAPSSDAVIFMDLGVGKDGVWWHSWGWGKTQANNSFKSKPEFNVVISVSTCLGWNCVGQPNIVIHSLALRHPWFGNAYLKSLDYAPYSLYLLRKLRRQVYTTGLVYQNEELEIVKKKVGWSMETCFLIVKTPENMKLARPGFLYISSDCVKPKGWRPVYPKGPEDRVEIPVDCSCGEKITVSRLVVPVQIQD